MCRNRAIHKSGPCNPSCLLQKAVPGAARSFAASPYLLLFFPSTDPGGCEGRVDSDGTHTTRALLAITKSDGASDTRRQQPPNARVRLVGKIPSARNSPRSAAAGPSRWKERWRAATTTKALVLRDERRFRVSHRNEPRSCDFRQCSRWSNSLRGRESDASFAVGASASPNALVLVVRR